MPDEFLTVAEVAELLKLNQETIRNMIDRGELASVRVGSRRVRVRRSDLDKFLDASWISHPALEPPGVVDEGCVTAWATFGPGERQRPTAVTRYSQRPTKRSYSSARDA